MHMSQKRPDVQDTWLWPSEPVHQTTGHLGGPPPPHIAKSEFLETLEPLPPKSGTNQHDVTTVEYQNELSQLAELSIAIQSMRQMPDVQRNM